MPSCFASAIDVGTSRVKLVMYDEGFNVISLVSEKSPLRVAGDEAVQEASEVAKLFRGFIARASQSGCKALGVSVFRGSMVAWRKDGLPASDVVTWLDRRTAKTYDELPLPAKLASYLPTIGAVFRPGSPALAARMLLTEPEVRGVVESGGFLWTLDSYLAYQLTGEFVADASQATLTGLISPYTLKPLGFPSKLLGLGRLSYPKIIGHDEPLAKIDGVSVGPFIADQQGASVGLGCLNPDCVKITMGTGVFVDKPLPGRPPLILKGGVIPVVLIYMKDGIIYGVEGFASGTGLFFEAIAGILGGFDRLEELARMEAPPLLVIPAAAGLRTPYKPHLQGAVLGAPPEFGPSSLAKGLMTGTALLVKVMYDAVMGVGGEPSRVRVGGGLSRLRMLVEYVSEAIGKPVEVSADPNDSARGAALLAAYSAGYISRRDLYDPPLSLKRIEPRGHGVEPEVERAWLKVVDVVGSASFSSLLARILRWPSRSPQSRE